MSSPLITNLKSKLVPLFPVASVVCWLVALGITITDVTSHNRWSSFWLYAFSLLSVTLFFVINSSHIIRHLTDILRSKKLWLWSIGVLLLAVFSRFWLLTTYPFVSVGDEVREVGLYAMQVAKGTRQDIFGYGAYDAYGMIIPTISSGFYSIFSSTVLTYRLQAALLGITDVVLVYLITYLATRRKAAAVIASLVLTTLPLHLYYSRTEVVVMYASTFTLLLLLMWHLVKQRPSASNLMMMSTLLGFTFGLYAAVRTVALAMLLLLIKELVLSYRKTSQLSDKSKRASAGKTMWQNFGLVLLFMLVGFGPRLWFTNSHNFFHTSRLPFLNTDSESATLLAVPKKYLDSVLVWYNRPTTSWYADHAPIVVPIFTLFLIVGVCGAIYKKNWFAIDIVLLALVLHATNSAMTDMVNADHRLAPLYGIGAILISIGILAVTDMVTNKWIRNLVFILVSAVCLAQLYGFFAYQPANKNKGEADYLSMHVIYLLQSKNISFDQISITVSPENFEKLETMHYHEQYEYFLPKAKVVFVSESILKNNEVIITTSPTSTSMEKTTVKPCQQYTCPPGLETYVLLERVH